MVKESILTAESRKEAGGGNARRLRKQGWLPAVVNNEKGEARMIKVNLHDFEQRLRHHTGENLILDMSIDGSNPFKVLLRDVQHDDLTDGLLHADFVEISMTRKMRVRIAIILRGDPVGVISEGGILEQLLRDVEVECLPTDLVEVIELDVSGLHLGKRLTVADLPVDRSKLTILTPPEVAVATVMAPQEEVVAPVEGAEATAAEPEVIGKGKEEEAEEEAAEEKEGAAKEAKGSSKETKASEAKPAKGEETKPPAKEKAKEKK